MKNSKGEVLYIGKATNLRSRVGSYFAKEASDRFQIRFLISKVDSVEAVITDNAKEALLLENTLIKKHRPRYNIQLKDDKSYISIRLTVKDEFPRIYVTRRIRKDGSLYFGPYASAWACREVADFIEAYFRLRTCSDSEFRNRIRPCLQYQIKRCEAPCVGYVDREAYGKVVRQVRMFLEGRSEELRGAIDEQMRAAADREEFEEAARLRDLTRVIDRTLEKQKVVSHRDLSRDVLGFYREGDAVSIYLMAVRQGALQENRSFHFKSLEEDGEVLTSFLLQYYGEGRFLPSELILPIYLDESEILGEILSERSEKKVEISVPQRGEKLALVKLAEQNAQQAFRSRGQKEKDVQETLFELQNRLDLSKLPQLIECYDISNFQGRESVGAMTTFREGKPYRQGYRHFKIKSVEGANDFASMYEVLTRRLRRAADGNSDWTLPDLIVIDGGKGQLNAAAQALRDQGVVGVDLIALAKSKLLGENWKSSVERQGPKPRSEERVFLPNRKNPIFFPANSSALFVLVQIRDEAHRFGIEFHRKLRQRRTLDSELEAVEGIGEARRKKLLLHFGSLKRIREASEEAIAAAIGVSLELAQRLKERLGALPSKVPLSSND